MAFVTSVASVASVAFVSLGTMYCTLESVVQMHMGNTDFAVAAEIDFAAAGTVGTVETAGTKPSGSLAYFDSDYKDFGKTAAAVHSVENVVEVRIVGKLLDLKARKQACP